MKHVKTLLFDLDGTLTNPRTGITRCIVHALEELGHQAPQPEELLWCIGPPLARSFERLLGTQDPHLVARAVAAYRERFSEIGLYENELIEGITEMLTRVERGRRLFVATSKPQVYTNRIIAHFGLSGFFEGVYGSELNGTRTEKSALLAYLLNQENIDPRDAIMIGDREHDVIGALSNGVQAIGVLWGFGSMDELTGAGADRVVSTPNELAELLEPDFQVSR